MQKSARLISLVSAIVFGVALSITLLAKADETLGVILESPVYYQNEKGDTFTARYGSLSDGSLHFVKITMPDGKTHTLPQVVSGSGARYTDDREIVWWEHHGTVRIDVRDVDGKWITEYQGLKEVKGKN